MTQEVKTQTTNNQSGEIFRRLRSMSTRKAYRLRVLRSNGGCRHHADDSEDAPNPRPPAAPTIFLARQTAPEA